MADDVQFATPDALAASIKEKHPVYAKIPNVDLAKKVLEKYPQYWGHVDQAAFSKVGLKGPHAEAAPTQVEPERPAPPPAEMPKSTYKPSWSHILKDSFKEAFSSIMHDPTSLFVGGGNTLAGTPGLAEGNQKELEQRAQGGDSSAKHAIEMQSMGKEPLIKASSTKTFQRAFDPKSKNVFSRGVTGLVKGAEGLTSPENVMLLGALPYAPEPVAKMLSGAFGIQMAEGAAASGKEAVQAVAKGESGDAAEKAVETILNVVMLHGSAAHAAGFEKVTPRQHLDTSSHELYKKPFNDLTDDEKERTLYHAAESANPRLKQSIDREVEHLDSKQSTSRAGLTRSEARAADISDAEKSQAAANLRLEATRKVIAQTIQKRIRTEQFKKAQLQAEARSRYEAEKTRAGEGQKSLAEARGFTINDERHTELGRQRENDLRPVDGKSAPAIGDPEASGVSDNNVVDGRQRATTIDRSSQLERPVQEYAEQAHGSSFSSLPLDKQREVASYFERENPTKWEAFRGTEAYGAFRRHADRVDAMTPAMNRWIQRTDEGGGADLNPGVDVMNGVARLIVARTDVNAAMRSHPEEYRAVNEYTEKNFGKSFETLDPEHRPAALAGYLRENPEAVGNFVSPDVAHRIESGQHIDLANMEASMADQQQVQVLMQHRDATRQAMDEEISGQSVREARDDLRRQTNEAINRAPAMETTAGNTMAEASRGVTRLAERITLDGVKAAGDVFQTERAVRQVPVRSRTADMTEFLSQMRKVRQIAESQAIAEYREGVVAQLRSDPSEGRQYSAREVVHFEEQRHTMHRMADALDGEYSLPEQKAEAAELRETADFIQRKEDAVIAAVETTRERPQREANPRFSPLLGRESRVRLNSGEEVPVHYAIASADDLITSHRSTDNYSVDPRYPSEAQPRDYANEPELQAAVEERAGRLDSEQILSNSVLPIEGPPIVLPDGTVLSGNGRTQSMKLAQKRGNYDEVYMDVMDRAEQFGIDPAAALGVSNPILVRVMDKTVTDAAELARYGIEMNRDPSQGMSAAEQSASLARMMTPSVVERMANIFRSVSGDASLRTAMRSRSAELGEVLRDAGLVDPKKRAQYFTDDGDLTEPAKQLVENALAGITVTNPNTIRRAPAGVVDKLGRVGMDFILMRSAGENWNLASYNTDAVDLFTRAQDQQAYLRRMEAPRTASGDVAEGGDSLIERMLHPERFRLSNLEMSFDGESTHAPVHPVVEAMARLLEESPRAYKDGVGDYAEAAEQGGATMFGAMHPADVFSDTIGKKYGITVLPEEWGMVGALPDEVRASIEESRQGLPVEPEQNHASVVEDVQPDSSPVTEVEKGRVARNVTELRRELARMPNISEEQAQALGDFAEHVLPRALGESLDDLMKNYRLQFMFGGEEGRARGYTEFVNDTQAVIRLMDSADPSTFLHETSHYLRKMLSVGDQAIANEFVGAKSGEEWSTAQEEQFAQAFERYHFDGGRRRGKMDKVFAVLHKAMQGIYDMARGTGLAKGNEKLNAMFDNWYDWTRKERQSITERNDVKAIEESSAGGKVTVPEGAEMIDGTVKEGKFSRNLVFGSLAEANDFLDKNSKTIRTYQVYDGKNGAFYVRVDMGGAKRLYQSGVGSVGDLARQARAIEDRLKQKLDPREEASLRAKLNSIDNKLGTSTFVFGRTAEVPNNEVIETAHGISEMPHLSEPTTPSQASAAVQVYGDPTAFEVEAKNGKSTEVRDVPDEVAGVPGSEGATSLPEPAGSADRGDEAAGRVVSGRGKSGGRGTADIATPEVNPLAKMPAASLKAPEKPRGTPVVSPEAWRGYADALGLPEGTPPPTVRLPEDLREMMIYPGQPEAIEVALSALQQYDGVVVASPTGSGKTWQFLAIADQLLGNEGNKVGLIVTRSKNLIHDSDGYVDVGKRLGVDVEGVPNDMKDIQGGGVYAATYSGIRGDKDLLSIPWDFVIFDESAEARKWMDSEQGKSVVALGHAAKKVVYGSATPFHTAVEVGYMHKLGMWPEGGFFEWARQFGVVETGPNTYTGGYAPKKLMKLRQQLIERGQWVSLHRDLEGVSAHVAMVEQTPEVQAGIQKVRDVFATARRIFQEQGKSSMARAAQAQEVIYLKRYIESARLPQALDMAKKAMADGWNPVIYSEYRSGTSEGMKFFENLPAGMDKHLNGMLPTLPNVVDAVRESLGDNAAIFAGEANELRGEEREHFLRGAKKAVYATYAAGGVGVSFHDKVGDRPRMGIFLGLPWSGIMLEQSMGRNWRYGTKSDVANVFLTSNSLPEIKVLSTKILPRMRALNAAVYGEVNETSLAKQMRESVGLAEEAIDYEMGNEVVPEAAHFEHTDTGKTFTKLEDFEMPKASAAKNRGMKYKTPPKRLYQGPADDAFSKDANPFLNIEMKDLPTFARRSFMANFPTIHADVVEEGKRAFLANEPVKPAMQRAAKDASIGLNLALGERGLLAAHTSKKNFAAAKQFAKEWMWLRHTSGDQAVRKFMSDVGRPEDGREVQRALIERSHLKAVFQGDLMTRVADILKEVSSPRVHETVVRVLEGKEESKDPKIMEAVDGYRKFFAYVRGTLADAGAKMKFYGKDGKETTITYAQIENDPNYWPHIYDWNKPLILDVAGKKTVTTLGELHDMPTDDARRQSFMEAYAAKRGITTMDADRFFSKNRREVRLSGNLEKGRRTSIPDYDMTQRGLSVYVNQVSDMLANIRTVGQEREKINPMIHTLPGDARRVVNSIVTADLNPQTIGESNKRVLRLASQWVVLSKMGLSTLKLPFHVAKASLAANMRSLAIGILGVATSPKEATRAARDAGILTDYVRQAMMMEYGLHTGGLDQKMLTATGFTLSIWISRIISGASGRVFLERYAAPELAKDPTNKELRRKLKDLYGFADADMDRIASKGYNAEDVKRAMVAAADWTTGSGRPSELPPTVRYVEDHPISKAQNTFLRMTWMLKTFTFKTTNLVNRTVFEGLKEGGTSGWKEKEYKAVGRWLVSFGAAGMGLRMMQIGVNLVANPAAAEEEKRRIKDALSNPKDALFLELGNVSYGMGIYPAKVLFDRLGTHNKGDVKKMEQQHRLENSLFEAGGGILASDFDHIGRSTLAWMQTFSDDGVGHKKSAADRRADIIGKLAKQEIAPLRAAEGLINKSTGGKKEATGDGLVLHRRRKPARKKRVLSENTSSVRYPHTATHEGTGHQIGSHDGDNWFDLETHEQVS